MKPMVIAAPNGARRGKAEHANLPISIAEIAAEAALCQRAGAAVLHLHVRDGNGAHSLDAGLYRAASEAIAEAAPGMLVQITTESAGCLIYLRKSPVLRPRGLMPSALHGGNLRLKKTLRRGDFMLGLRMKAFMCSIFCIHPRI